jgi:alkylation response protein AidB-like acyl-CoA dehydrogenase
MRIAYTPDQEALRDRLRQFMVQLMTPELCEELHHNDGGGPLYHKALGQLAAEGWLGLGWPKEYGGGGATPIEEFLFFDEVHRAGFPVPLLTLNTVGPALMAHGSEALKKRFLPAILRGEVHFSIGYTEPSAGTDLASLETRAVRDGDHWVISGQKIFISLASFADYLWCACRTNPDVSKHKGLSVFVVPMNAPGVAITPIKNLSDADLNTVYLQDVRVPAENLVGRVDGGWRIITSQLNHERVALMMVGPLVRNAREVRDWAAWYPDGAGVLLDRPWVRRNLAQAEVGLEVLKLMNWRQAWNLGQGAIRMEEASSIKVYGSELYIEVNRLLLEIPGALGTLRLGSPGAILGGRLERYDRAMRVLTFGGGTNEVQRSIIAGAALHLPRQRG